MDPRKWRLFKSLMGNKTNSWFFNGTLAQSTGVGATGATLTRSSAQYVRDSYGYLYPVVSGSAAYPGLRHVTNLTPAPFDFSDASWNVKTTITTANGISDPNGGTLAGTVTATGNNSVLQYYTAVAATFVAYSEIWLRRRTGTGQVYICDAQAKAWWPVTLTSSWQKFTSKQLCANLYRSVGVKLAVNGDAVDIAFPFLDDVTNKDHFYPDMPLPTTATLGSCSNRYQSTSYAILGDSTSASYLGYEPISKFFPKNGWYNCIDVAYAGDKISAQGTKWAAVSAARKATVKSVVIMAGLNDIADYATASAATILGRLQTLVNTVASDCPTASIYVATMTPAKQRWIDLFGAGDGATCYQLWQDINTGITGGGANPITGVTGRISAHTAALNDGSGNLSSTYDSGDHIHETNAAREIIADYFYTTMSASYSPVNTTLESSGVLCEPEVTNLSLYSNSFTDWTQSATPLTLSQNVTGPDGITNSAWSMTDSSTLAGVSYILKNYTLTAAKYSRSIFVKKTTSGETGYPVLSLETGTVLVMYTIDTRNGIATKWTAYTGFTINNNSSAVVESYNADYWRVSITFTATATLYSNVIRPTGALTPNKSSGTIDNTAMGTNVFFGDKLELGFPTSYVPSGSTASFRAATVFLSPIPLWTGVGLRTASLDFTPEGYTTGQLQVLLSDYTDNSNYSYLGYDGSAVTMNKVVGGVTETASYSLSAELGTTHHVQAGYNPNNTIVLTVDGNPQTSNNSTTLSPIEGFNWGIGNLNSGNVFCGEIKNLRIDNSSQESMHYPLGDVASYIADTRTPVRYIDHLDISNLATVSYSTSATRMTVAPWNSIFSTFPDYARIGIDVDGVALEEITLGANGATSHVVNLPPGEKVVTLIAGLQSKPSSTVIGSFFAWVGFNSPVTYVDPGDPVQRFLVYGDSIASGGNSTSAIRDGVWSLLRYYRAGKSTVLESYGYRSLYNDANTSPLRAALVSTIAQYAPATIWLAIGTNDYGLNKWTAANFQTAYASLLDDLHTALPSAVIYAQTPLTRTNETANGLGNTLGDYRTAIANASAGKGWVTVVDGPSLMASGGLSVDGIHPSTAGHSSYFSAVKTVLGI